MSRESVTIGKHTYYYDGRIYSHFYKRFLTGYICSYGYRKVSVNGKLSSVHRLIASAFIPNPENKPEVNHIDGNKLNNNVTNLEWVTKQENITHAVKNGLRGNLKGEQIYNTKFLPWQVKAIRFFNEYKIYSRKQLAEFYGVSVSCIKAICLRQNWAHI